MTTTQSSDPLDIFADPAPRAGSPEPAAVSSAASNPFDPLSPASRPADTTAKKVDSNDLLSQIADWGAKNHGEDSAKEEGRAPEEAKETEKEKINPNVMATREDAVDLSDEAIEKVHQQIEAAKLE